MAISTWLCKSSTKSMFVKIVHQGGHVELYESRVQAKEILVRNPRHCVAYPHVFKQPWAVVSPETMLMPGQKYFLVPIRTIRKLQKLSSRHSSNICKTTKAIDSLCYEDQVGDAEAFPCWLCTNKRKGAQRASKTSDDSCFGCLISHTKTKGKSNKTISSTFSGSSESTRNRENKRADSPRRHSSFDSWQPSLEIIAEE